MANNTIKLAVYGIPPVELEIPAVAAIDPGMLLTRDNTGGVEPHGVAEGFSSPKLIAVENIFEGKTINDQYAIDEKVFIIGARPGDEMWMWMGVLQSCAIGDRLVSEGTGHLVVATDPPSLLIYTSIIGTALEVITGVPVVPTRVRVEIA